MTPYASGNGWALYLADYRDTLAACDGAADLVLTSPPYADARSYGMGCDWGMEDYAALGDAVFAALRPGGHALINVDAPVREWRPGEGHFAVTGAIAVGPCTVTLPRIGAVRIMPGDRGYAPTMRYVAASVVQEHGEWFVSVRVEAADAEPAPEDAPRVGLDIGVRKLAVLSDGTVFTNPKALRRAELRLKRAQRVLSRRVRGSGRRRDARKRLAARHQRVANVRRDALHKATTMIARMHPVVVVEDLKVRGMTRRAHGKGRAVKAGLNRSILDASFGEFRRMLAYKLAMRGGRLIAVHAAYTSQTCSACQSRTNCGSNETFTCAACGFTVDRDLNAAINIRARSYGPNDAASWPESPPSGGNARGGAVRHRERKLAVLAPMKRELERDHV